MKLLIIGAAGILGSRILQEAVSRGHDVTAVVRREGALSSEQDVRVVQADVRDAGVAASIFAGHDAVVVAVSARRGGDAPVPEVVRAAIDGARDASVTRLFVLGGAGSLEVAPGVQLLDAPGFPEAYRAEAIQGREALNVIRDSDVNWTYLSPAAEISPGERTGRYRVGGDQLLTDAEGKSFISAEDYAVAVLDELEHPRHERQRFTVAY
ncbi:MAG TPA: NAD(P)-dependent oxidoreductase [Rubrobacteraceae bacterium]|nr:NAD(P)-dependent oxidoreductase [Rubrobacteraceae bacterium]